MDRLPDRWIEILRFLTPLLFIFLLIMSLRGELGHLQSQEQLETKKHSYDYRLIEAETVKGDSNLEKGFQALKAKDSLRAIYYFNMVQGKDTPRANYGLSIALLNRNKIYEALFYAYRSSRLGFTPSLNLSGSILERISMAEDDPALKKRYQLLALRYFELGELYDRPTGSRLILSHELSYRRILNLQSMMPEDPGMKAQVKSCCENGFITCCLKLSNSKQAPNFSKTLLPFPIPAK